MNFHFFFDSVPIFSPLTFPPSHPPPPIINTSISYFSSTNLLHDVISIFFGGHLLKLNPGKGDAFEAQRTLLIFFLASFSLITVSMTTTINIPQVSLTNVALVVRSSNARDVGVQRRGVEGGRRKGWKN